MMITARLVSSLLFAGLLFAGLPSLPASAVESTLVKIQNFAFVPQNLTVKAGTTVIFKNEDDIPHLVVANDGSFRSEALDTNDQYTITLGKAGTVPYFCGLHPHMEGTIKVVP